MMYRVKLLILIVALLSIAVPIFAFGDPENSFIYNWGKPIMIGSATLIIVLLLLLFFPQSVFDSWIKFARIAIPISFLLVVLSYCSGRGFFSFCLIDQESATALVGAIFLIITVGIIISKRFLKK